MAGAAAEAIEAALARSLLIIPSIDGGHLLARMLPTLRVPPRIVAVLDQASTDTTAAVCRASGVELVQLGRAQTFTEACNAGYRLARERGCDFLFVANNDIVFTTDVARQLLAEMLEDDELGIVAPSQLMVGPEAPQGRLAYRVFWNLERLEFGHDLTPPDGDPERLEADFCELTFALIRMSAIERIGFLDDAYGFYHEDADFGFRLREAGYACAYLPRAQIEHYTGSTFGADPERREAYQARNRARFAARFLGPKVNLPALESFDGSSWAIVNRYLRPYLGRYGLLDPGAPRLKFTHPGDMPVDVLYTVWETTRLPAEWLAFRHSYRAVLAGSRWVAGVLDDAGFAPVHLVRLGVETDVFHPWGPRQRLGDGLTFLWLARNQHRKGLDVMLRAWAEFSAEAPGALLVLMGQGIGVHLPWPAASRRRQGVFAIEDYPEQRVRLYEQVGVLEERDLAAIYRGVDFVVCSSRSEGFGLVVAEAMASGVLPIFGDYSATGEFSFEGALTFPGTPVRADYSDKGFADVGEWWEPDVAGLAGQLRRAAGLDAATYARLAARGVRLVRSRFSWRQTAIAMRAALIASGIGGATAPSSPPPRRWSGLVRNLGRAARLADQVAASVASRGLRAGLRDAGRSVWLFVRTRLGRPARARATNDVPSRPAEPLPRREGVLFVGYTEAGLGLGEAHRAMIDAAAAVGLPFGIHPVRLGVEDRIVAPFRSDSVDHGHRYDVNVFEAGADQVQPILAGLDPRLREGAYNIARLYWELPQAPPAWRDALVGIDELWVPDPYVREAFATVFRGPITVIPPHVTADLSSPPPSREALGLAEGRFTYLFTFDYHSSLARKNPIGVLDAFRRAFPRGDEPVALVLKSSGAPSAPPGVRSRLAAAAAADPRILVLDRYLGRRELLGLIAAADCYVSLHRAEGFGLGMAEAMLLGRPVIGTDFSGSTDFLSEATGFPVPARLRPVRPGEYKFEAGQVWAEPDPDAAAAAFRLVRERPDLAAARAAAGQALVRKRYGAAAVGELMRARLAEIARLRG